MSIFWPIHSSLLITNKTEEKNGTKRANMSTVMNKGVNMSYKYVTEKLFTVVGLLVEPITAIGKKGSLQEYISIRYYYLAVTYSITVIPPALTRSLFYISTMRLNSRSHKIRDIRRSTVESEVANSADLCLTRIRTGKIKCTESRNCLSIIKLIKKKYVIFQIPNIR